MLKNEKRQSVFLGLSDCFSVIFVFFSKSTFLSQLHFPKESFFRGVLRVKEEPFPPPPLPPITVATPKRVNHHHPFSLPPFSIAFSGGKLGTGLPFRTPPLSTPPLGVGGWVGFWAGEGGDGKKRWRKRNCTAIGLGEKGCGERNGFVCILLLCKHHYLAVIERNLNTKGERKIPCFPPSPGGHINSRERGGANPCRKFFARVLCFSKKRMKKISPVEGGGEVHTCHDGLSKKGDENVRD